MAFTATDKIAIAKVLGMSVIEVDNHISVFAPNYTQEIYVAVLSLLLEYGGLPLDKGIEIFPTTTNRGVRLKNARLVAEERIKEAIIGLLAFPPQNDRTILLTRR